MWEACELFEGGDGGQNQPASEDGRAGSLEAEAPPALASLAELASEGDPSLLQSSSSLGPQQSSYNPLYEALPGDECQYSTLSVSALRHRDLEGGSTVEASKQAGAPELDDSGELGG